MRLRDLLEGASFKTQYHKRYTKGRDAIARSDPKFRKKVKEFETRFVDLAKYKENPGEMNENAQVLGSQFNLHRLPAKNATGKAAGVVSAYKDAAWVLFQAHIPSSQKKGRYVTLAGINRKESLIDFIICGTHDDTTGG